MEIFLGILIVVFVFLLVYKIVRAKSKPTATVNTMGGGINPSTRHPTNKE